MSMKQKYYILANSLAFDIPLETRTEDYTDSDLSDADILDELSDTCAEFQQGFYNVIVITEAEAKVIADLFSENNISKDS